RTAPTGRYRPATAKLGGYGRRFTHEARPDLESEGGRVGRERNHTSCLDRRVEGFRLATGLRYQTSWAQQLAAQCLEVEGLGGLVREEVARGRARHIGDILFSVGLTRANAQYWSKQHPAFERALWHSGVPSPRNHWPRYLSYIRHGTIDRYR